VTDGGRGSGRYNPRRRFEAVEADEDVDNTHISESEVVADGVELSRVKGGRRRAQEVDATFAIPAVLAHRAIAQWLPAMPPPWRSGDATVAQAGSGSRLSRAIRSGSGGCVDQMLAGPGPAAACSSWPCATSRSKSLISAGP
jgi:hypothetical protein